MTIPGRKSYYGARKMQQTKTKPKLRTITCNLCKRAISYDPAVIGSGKAILDHRWAEHTQEMRQQTEKALAVKRQKAQERRGNFQSSRDSPQDSQGSPGTTKVQKPREEPLKATLSPEEANVFVIRPQKYEINSLFILIAKHICENEWKWPEKTVSQWLDLYLFHTMRQRGYVIGAYQKLEEVGDGRH